MPDLNVSLSYHNHRKTKRLIAALGRDADVLPLRLWAYVGDAHPEDGKLIGYTVSEIESFMGWRGHEGKAVEAFVTTGWLEVIEGGYKVHDWEEHQGHLAAFKIRGKAAATARWEKARLCIKHATSIPQAMLETCSDGRTERTDVYPNTHTREDKKVEPPPEAHIPTAEELQRHFSIGLNIPLAYCQHYAEQKHIRNSWILNGQLCRWQIELPKWWAKDKGTFGKSKSNPPPQTQSSIPKPKGKDL